MSEKLLILWSWYAGFKLQNYAAPAKKWSCFGRKSKQICGCRAAEPGSDTVYGKIYCMFQIQLTRNARQAGAGIHFNHPSSSNQLIEKISWIQKQYRIISLGYDIECIRVSHQLWWEWSLINTWGQVNLLTFISLTGNWRMMHKNVIHKQQT